MIESHFFMSREGVAGIKEYRVREIYTYRTYTQGSKSVFDWCQFSLDIAIYNI